MNWNSRLSCVILAMLLVGSTAIANPVPNYATWNFSGIVRHYENANVPNVPGTVPPQDLAAVGVLPGTLLTGTITLDLDSPDGAPEASRGQFGPVVAAKMNVGNLNLKYNPSAGINLTVINNHPSVEDLFSSAFSMSSSQYSGAILGFLELNDRTKKAFTSDQLPAILPPLSAFDAYNSTAAYQTRVGFAVNANSGIWLVHAELTQLQQNPEPSAIALIGAAMIGALGCRHRKCYPPLDS
jgi:hypothetical protein